MFNNTIKRSVATLGVVAGLLAAAGPASAQSGGADPTRGPQELGFRVEIGSLPCARAVDGGNDTLDARTNPSFTVDPQDGATRSAPPMGVTANAGTGDDNADGLLDETAQPQLTDGTSNTLQYAAARQARGFPSVDGLKFDTDVVDY